MKKINWLLITVFAVVFSGCSWFGFGDSGEMNKSAETLVSEGTSSFSEGDYKTAVKAYSDLRDWYPFSKYAILAELKIADAHYALKEYDEALFAYAEFEKMHPKNEAIPYVIYQSGLCWFDQIRSVDRDATPARKSMELFNRLIDQYPDSNYVPMAKEKIVTCIENLAGHELYVAHFYLKTKKYPAALKRYEYLAENFPETEQGKEALAFIPKCEAFLEKNKIKN